MQRSHVENKHNQISFRRRTQSIIHKTARTRDAYLPYHLLPNPKIPNPRTQPAIPTIPYHTIPDHNLPSCLPPNFLNPNSQPPNLSPTKSNPSNQSKQTQPSPVRPFAPSLLPFANPSRAGHEIHIYVEILRKRGDRCPIINSENMRG
ncbi:hypothetical protein NA56DRAFT_185374 [Hyaloscypha hepaticicola]|uniref:Uncharacterized protein n=1 Tax=Hyaloscypha hepaticicola TaxID=2082293 RepID=A0A2J6Q1H2_9HELO|nr:hypothetical protein NA56DRAFT_185374 [Hyaloscypha hepaticicola]